jgi:hypothetical protein
MTRLRLPLAVYSLVFATALLLAALLASSARAAIERVDRVAITVADLDRALAFYTRVLPFELVAEHEVAGEAWERLLGVFALGQALLARSPSGHAILAYQPRS